MQMQKNTWWYERNHYLFWQHNAFIILKTLTLWAELSALTSEKQNSTYLPSSLSHVHRFLSYKTMVLHWLPNASLYIIVCREKAFRKCSFGGHAAPACILEAWWWHHSEKAKINARTCSKGDDRDLGVNLCNAWTNTLSREYSISKVNVHLKRYGYEVKIISNNDVDSEIN